MKIIIFLILSSFTLMANSQTDRFDSKVKYEYNVYLEVLNEYLQPITTTSINKTGSEPLYNPDEIEEQFGDEIDLLIDEGEIKNSPSKIFIFDNDEIKQIR